MKLSTIPTLLIKAIESILVIGYIVFEEIIWNTFALPIFDYLKSLAILDALKQTFLTMNRYLLVSVFIFILVLTEYMGILSVLMIARQQLMLGVFTYALKIPIATFTFWLFELTKPQLLTFNWLKIAYETIMKWIDLLIHSAIYQAVKARITTLKQNLRVIINRLKDMALFNTLKSCYKGVQSYFLKQGKS
jgi:hypothetical protein